MIPAARFLRPSVVRVCRSVPLHALPRCTSLRSPLRPVVLPRFFAIANSDAKSDTDKANDAQPNATAEQTQAAAAGEETKTSTDDSHTAPPSSIREAFESLKNQLVSPIGIASIGGVTALYLGWKITSFMTHVSFAGIGEYAFVIGLAGGAALAGGCVWGARFFSRRPEYVYNRTINMVKRSERAVVFMGGHNIYGGNFRAYHTIPLAQVGPKEDWALPKEWHGLDSINRIFKPVAFHVMFTVQSKDKIAMVSAEILKQGNHFAYQSLYLSLLPSGERLLLEGDDKLIYEKTIAFAVSD
jgi:hypothetical protein